MITIIEQPNNWQNLYNEIVIGVSGGNITKPNYQFLCDVNVSGQSNPVTRLTLPKQPLVGTVQINVADVVKNYVTYDIVSYNATGILANNNSVAKYWLEFGEIYDNASGVPVIYPNLAQYGTSGSPKFGSNAIFDFLDWSKTAFSAGRLLSLTNRVSLNQTTFTPSIRAGQQMWLSFFQLSTLIEMIDLRFYDAAGVFFDERNAFPSAVSGIVSVNVGYSMLNSLGVSGYMSNNNLAYYDVVCYDNGNDVLFTKRVNIDTSCNNYKVYRLHWLNSLGGFDCFNFKMVSTERIEIESKDFKKVQRFNYQSTDRLKTKYFTKFMESIVLNSDLLTDAEYAGLEELALSPVVILEVDSNTYVPVNVVANNYVKRKYEQGRSIPTMELTIEYTFDNYRQSL